MFEFVIVTQEGIEIQPELLVEKELRDVFTRDKSKSKQKATKELLYIVSVAKFGSPYFHWTTKKQHEDLGTSIFGKPYSPDSKVQKAIDKLLTLQEDSFPAFRYYRAASAVLNKLTSLVKDMDPSDRDEQGRPTFSITDLSTYVKQAYPMADQLDKLQQMIIKQKFSVTKTKADRGVNHFER